MTREATLGFLMQRFVFLASDFFPCSATFVCQATSSCAMVLRMFYHGNYRVAIYCTVDLLPKQLWWDTTGVLETAEFTLANQQKFWINPWQLGLVSPDSDRNSMKFLSEDGFCEIQDDEVSRFHCFSAVGDPRLMQNKSSLDDHGWSLPVPQEPMTSWHFFKIAPIEQLSKPAKKFYAP